MLQNPKSPCLMHPEITMCGEEESRCLVTGEITRGSAQKELVWDPWAAGS